MIEILEAILALTTVSGILVVLFFLLFFSMWLSDKFEEA
jgi:hypothetical protein